MSRLFIVTQPDLVTGFQLAGVEAYAAQTPAQAQELIAKWLAEGETGLLAVDESLLAGFTTTFKQRLAAADQLPYLQLPGVMPHTKGRSSQQRITELLRRAIGFHISFKGGD